jgi:phosphoglycolate phosphatase
MIRFHNRFDPSSLRLVIFDLDGTLIDSRLDLIHSVNATLRHLDRPELPGDLIASYVGDGAPMLIRRALGDPKNEAFIKQALDYFLNYYRVHKLDFTRAYDGVEQMLKAIRIGNRVPRQMVVLSNKPVNASRAIVDALGLAEFFVRVYGGNSFPTKKPDPHGVRMILRESKAPAEEALIIGDSSIDVITGRNAGIWTCGVTYGFAPHTLCEATPDVVVDRPQDIAELLR